MEKVEHFQDNKRTETECEILDDDEDCKATNMNKDIKKIEMTMILLSVKILP